MKYLKMLGLAAVAAMALTAFLGASSASATVLCTTTPPTGTPCGTGWHVDELDLSIPAGGSVELSSTGGAFEATCTVATTKVTKDVTGSSTTTAAGIVEKGELTWGPVGNGCTNTTDTVHGGTLEIHWISGTDNGTVTAKEFEVTVVLAGVSCTFGVGAGQSIGDLTGGAPAVMHVNTVVNKTAGSFLCPADSKWVGTYVVTNHTTVHVVTS
jgi:hypothetical protein